MLGLQLNDLAKRVGISSSALSQIENAKSYPSILTLKLIAENLKTTVGELIGENEFLINNPVFRNDDVSLMDKNESGAELYQFTQQDMSKQMDTFKIRFQPSSNSIGLFKKHTGQIFGYLLEGEVEFEIDSRSYVVQKGDTIYFNGKRNFRIQNIYDGVSELLCVSTLPSQ